MGVCVCHGMSPGFGFLMVEEGGLVMVFCGMDSLGFLPPSHPLLAL